MEKLLPSQFNEALGGASFAFAILLTFLSLIPRIRTITIRLSAILFLTTFALFANHWSTYFAAIFIIATAVTELEFLHVLAAIIRGDKNYFDFRREYLTQEEVMKRAAEMAVQETTPEASAEEGTDSSPVQLPHTIIDLSSQSRMHIAFQIEAAALEWLQNDLGRSVERHVRFSSEAGFVELDGVVQGSRRTRDLIVEVKWVYNYRFEEYFLRLSAPRLVELGNLYKKITNRDSELIVVFVAPTKESISERFLEQVRGSFQEGGIVFRVIVVTYDQLGIKVTEDPSRK